MDTTKQATQPQSQTMQSIDWLFQDRDEDDFDLIEFGIASNGGRLSIKGAMPPLTPSACIHSNFFHSSNISFERNSNLIHHYNNYIIYNC